MPNPKDSTLLDKAQARFITEQVAINVASCNAELVPTVSRAYGCRVARDRRTVTVFLAMQRSEALLRDLGAGRPISAVFTRPSTHETLQLKGAKAEISPLKKGDRALMRAFGQGFSEHILRRGFQEPFASAIIAPVEEEAVAITFRLTAAFVQTPGPAAGRPLASKP